MTKLLKRSERGLSLRRVDGDLRRRKQFAGKIADCFFAETPFQRMLMRCGRARKQMQAYRELKHIRRPRRFRQDVW
jgi:hypothetical protein